MLKRSHKIISLLLVLLMLISILPMVQVSAETYGDFTYSQEWQAKEITITKYRGTAASVTIPSEINGFPVTAIGRNCFQDNEITKNITIPSSVTSINAWAFAHCHALEKITIPDSVQSIGESAFNSCYALKEINIGKGVSQIGGLAFANTSTLETITVSPESPYLTVSDGILYSKDMTTLYLSFSKEIKTSFAVPEGVKTIADGAISTCTNLVELTLPDSLTTIEGKLIAGNTNIESIVIPKNVTKLGSGSFSGCSNLKSVLLLGNISVIDSSTFYNCTSLENITLPESVTRIEDWAFRDCTALKSITLPEGLEYLGEWVFKGCTSLEQITIPGKVEMIDYQTFSDCVSLKEATIKEGVKTIRGGAFVYCVSLTTVHLPVSITTIGSNAFGGAYAWKMNIKDVYYAGTEAQWNQIDIDDNNEPLTGAALHFSSAPSATVPVSGCTITLSKDSYIYDGKAKTPTVTVKYGNTTLKEGTDYTLTYYNNKSVGTASVSISGLGRYTGSTTKHYTIVANTTPITDCTFTLSSSSYTYDGTEKKPSVTIKDGSETLVNGTDYTLSYANNKNIGTASVTATGKGDYTGTKTLYFAIVADTSNFIWGKDNWNFNNTNRYFSSYDVNSTIKKKMQNHLNLSNATIADLEENIKDWNADGWGGSCYGMAVSEILVKQGDLKLSDFGGNDVVYKNTNSSNMISLINFIQVMQLNGRFCQSIRQTAHNPNSYTQDSFISKLEETLTTEKSMIKISYGISTTNLYTGASNYGYHAVVGYGVENCSYKSELTGKTYDKRILIADPNYSAYTSVYDDACIYYRSSDHSWIIPYWNYTSTSSMRRCYWNAGTDAYNGKINGISKYNTVNNMVDLMADYTVNHYLAGLEIDNLSNNTTYVEQIVNSGNPALDFAGNDGYGIARYDIYLDDIYMVNSNTELYSLWNGTASYFVSYDTPSDYNLKMDYKDVIYHADLTNSSYTQFKPSGKIDVFGSDADYDITIITEDVACVTNWHSMRAAGKDVDNVTFSIEDNGYILDASNLKNVILSAKGEKGEIHTTFSTDCDSVFIYEIDEVTIGVMVDTDNNGIYETLLDTETKRNFDLGDTNMDGDINIKDATAIQKHIAMLEILSAQAQKLADYDTDGVITIKDATAIQKLIAGLI